jgi:hypothetical protein
MISVPDPESTPAKEAVPPHPPGDPQSSGWSAEEDEPPGAAKALSAAMAARFEQIKRDAEGV